MQNPDLDCICEEGKSELLNTKVPNGARLVSETTWSIVSVPTLAAVRFRTRSCVPAEWNWELVISEQSFPERFSSSVLDSYKLNKIIMF